MHESDRVKLLFGPYRMPVCKVGRTLRCRIRSRAVVRGITDAPIQWPYTWRNNIDRRASLILCGDLVRAVRHESETAVSHWWGVSMQTVWKWRKALGVDRQTAGTVDLQRRGMPDHIDEAARQKAIASTQCPERNARIAAALRGKRRPRYVVEALIKANKGRKLSADQRRKMSEAHQRRGTIPPAAGVPWKPDEDALLGTMKDREVAERIGRSEAAVSERRYVLDVAALTKRAPRGKPIAWTPAKDRLLGTMSDVDLACRLRCSPMTVFYRRRRLKIPPWRG
jgi:hypothetical protein